MTVAQLLETRLAELGKTRTELRAELARRGVRVTRQAVHAWFHGIAKPTPANVVALWDVLVIPMSERPAWMEALAHTEAA
jgi:hypothetical protein